MKSNFLPVILFAAATIVAGCDKIEGPVHQQNAGTIDTTCTFADDPSPARKKVLFEDYTGFLCGNCPDAGIYLNDTLRPQYGDSLIVISVHSNFFAIPCGQTGGACPGNQPAGAFQTDFRCPAGESWYTTFGIRGNPLGLIDRIDYPPPMDFPKSQWPGKINAEFTRSPEARLRIENSYEPASRKLRTCIESKILNNVTDTFRLQVVLTEDSVTDWQLWYNHAPSEFVDNYVHRHVLRTSVNGSFGTVIASGTITAGTTVVTGYTLTLDPAWIDSRCHVVAFLYKENNYRVLQAEEAAVTE